MTERCKFFEAGQSSSGKTKVWDVASVAPRIRARLDALLAREKAAGRSIDMSSLMEAALAANERLIELANHLRCCRQCGESDVYDCIDGKPLWDGCFPKTVGASHK